MYCSMVELAIPQLRQSGQVPRGIIDQAPGLQSPFVPDAIPPFEVVMGRVPPVVIERIVIDQAILICILPACIWFFSQ